MSAPEQAFLLLPGQTFRTVESAGFAISNSTRRPLQVTVSEASDHCPKHVNLVLPIVLPEEYVDPLRKELDETKQVLGDLLQEKLAGAKVYVVTYMETGFIEPHPRCHLSIEAAKRWIDTDRSAGPNPLRELNWTRNTRGVPPITQWRSDSSYAITEYEVSG